MLKEQTSFVLLIVGAFCHSEGTSFLFCHSSEGILSFCYSEGTFLLCPSEAEGTIFLFWPSRGAHFFFVILRERFFFVILRERKRPKNPQIVFWILCYADARSGRQLYTVILRALGPKNPQVD